MSLQVIQIPVRKDNYVYVLHESGNRAAAVVDPGVADPVLQVLAEHELDLGWILNTHHHDDHTGGNLMLQQKTNCRIAGPAREASRIPGITHPLDEDDIFDLFSRKATILDVGGHTLGHIAYVFMQDMRLFCGDALFAMGCGRLFEGDAKQAWTSLQKLRALPDAMQVYCAHEYTEANSRFALTITPDNKALQERAKQVAAQRKQGLPTVPFRLADDKATNPFLRADDPVVAQAVGREGAPGDVVFGALRQMKDVF
jgi:hydroxyacylglutathione hydrolase